jgi:hypothetical protein
MNRFVEDCRREWARLQVPEGVANEMAAELEADLAEAEAEGVSAEELLGRGVFDARTFAAAWAAERGVVPVQSPAERRRKWSTPPAIVVALAVLVVFALVGVALLHAHASTSVVIKQSRTAFFPGPLERVHVGPFAGPTIVRPDVAAVNQETSVAGVTLLLVGIVGIVVTLAVWWASSRWRRPPAATA